MNIEDNPKAEEAVMELFSSGNVPREVLTVIKGNPVERDEEDGSLPPPDLVIDGVPFRLGEVAVTLLPYPK